MTITHSHQHRPSDAALVAAISAYPATRGVAAVVLPERRTQEAIGTRPVRPARRAATPIRRLRLRLAAQLG